MSFTSPCSDNDEGNDNISDALVVNLSPNADENVNTLDGDISTKKEGRALMDTTVTKLLLSLDEQTVKQLLIEAGSEIGAKTRESLQKVKNIKLEELRHTIDACKTKGQPRIRKLKHNPSLPDIAHSCLQLNREIRKLTEIADDSRTLKIDRNVAKVEIFGLLLKMQKNFDVAEKIVKDKQKKTKNDTAKKQYIQTLRKTLQITYNSHAKLRRKAKHVKQLADLMGEGGSLLMGMYISIYTMENGSNDEWVSIRDTILRNSLLMHFCHELKVNGVFPAYNIQKR